MTNQQMNAIISGAEMAQLGVDMETIRYSREPPPPYAVTDMRVNQVPTLSDQSVIHQTIIIQQTLKDVPVYCNCPSCHKRTLTTVQFVSSHKTHMLAGFICGLTIWCMLCCLATIPYVFSTFKTADHFCSNCNYYLGSYSKL